MEASERFAENLRRLRRRAGISQEELGYRSSLHRTQIGLLEKGVRVPKIDTLIKLASCLGVRIDCALLDGIEWVPLEDSEGKLRVESREEEARRVSSRRFMPRTLWWQEPFAVFGDTSIDSSQMPAVSEGVRESGMVLIRVLETYPWEQDYRSLVSGLAQRVGGSEHEERFVEAVNDLTRVGLIHLCAGQLTPNAGAREFAHILSAANELRYSRR